MKQKTKGNKENQIFVINRLKEREIEINPYDRTYYSYTVENKPSLDGEVFIVERIKHESKLKIKGTVSTIGQKSIKTRKVLNRTTESPVMKKENL